MNRSISLLLATVAVALGPGSVVAQARSGGPVLKSLDQNEVLALAPKVRSIKAEPATLTLHVGETVVFTRITVTVVDSSGKTRGVLPGYDFAIKPGEPATAVPRQVTGVRPGTTELRIMYPRNSWKARTDPRAEAHVKIVVVK